MGTITRKHGAPDQRTDTRAAGLTSAGRDQEAGVSGKTVNAMRDRIRHRAYEIYCGRISSGVAGDASSDWLQAERELNGAAPDPVTSAAIEVRARARGERLLASGE